MAAGIDGFVRLSRRCWVDVESCGPAVYRWTCATSGNELRLCERCCAEWRACADRQGMLLAPSRITLLENDHPDYDPAWT